MKSLLMLTMGLAMSLNVSAKMGGIAPAIKALDAKSLAAVEALLKADEKKLLAFKDAGNKVDSVTVQAVSSSLTIYTFSNVNQAEGGVAAGVPVGGAQLIVTVDKQRNGEQVVEKVETKLFRKR